jgi:hypothetical protein
MEQPLSHLSFLHFQLGGDEVSYLVTMMNELQKVYNMDRGELWTVFCPRIGMETFSAVGLAWVGCILCGGLCVLAYLLPPCKMS